MLIAITFGFSAVCFELDRIFSFLSNERIETEVSKKLDFKALNSKYRVVWYNIFVEGVDHYKVHYKLHIIKMCDLRTSDQWSLTIEEQNAKSGLSYMIHLVDGIYNVDSTCGNLTIHVVKGPKIVQYQEGQLAMKNVEGSLCWRESWEFWNKLIGL